MTRYRAFAWPERPHRPTAVDDLSPRSHDPRDWSGFPGPPSNAQACHRYRYGTEIADCPDGCDWSIARAYVEAVDPDVAEQVERAELLGGATQPTAAEPLHNQERDPAFEWPDHA